MDQKTIDCRSVGKGIWAFTLIELLVVVAIIAVLVAILLPAIQKARKQTKILTCGTQMRQIGVALYTYAGDNQDFFPRCGTGNMGDWSHLAEPLEKTGMIRSPAIYYCPDGCPWNIVYPRDVGKMIGYYVRWASYGWHKYRMSDPSGIALVTEPCGWWGGWSHPANSDMQPDSGFNLLFLDGSVTYMAIALPPVSANWWEPFDRRDFDRSWYYLKGGEYNP